MRVRAGWPFKLSQAFALADEEEAPAIVGPVVLTVADADGLTVHTATAVVDEAGVWAATVPGQNEGIYSATWAASSDGVTVRELFEATGRPLFTVAQARGSDMDLADVNRFPAADIKHYRDVVESEFQAITGRSFVPRVARASFTADGTRTAFIGVYDVLAVLAVDGPAGLVDEAELAGWSVSPTGFVRAPVELDEGGGYVLTVRYGHESAPADIVRAGLLRVRSLLAAERSGIPDRATSFVAAEGGNFTLATPGRNGSETGIPEVDATLARYRYRLIEDVLGMAF